MVQELLLAHPELYNRLLHEGGGASGHIKEQSAISSSAEPKNNNGSSSLSGLSKTGTFAAANGNRLAARDSSQQHDHSGAGSLRPFHQVSSSTQGELV